MTNCLITEIHNIKKIMGILNEGEELTSQASDLSKIQNLLDLEEIDVKAEDILDKTEPICHPPKTKNQEDDNIIGSFWEWVNQPSNKNKLKTIFKSIKDIVYDDENLEESLVLGDLILTRSDIKSIGDYLLTISILGLIDKSTNCE